MDFRENYVVENSHGCLFISAFFFLRGKWMGGIRSHGADFMTGCVIDCVAGGWVAVEERVEVDLRAAGSVHAPLWLLGK